jgi:hypothetical protein
MSVGPSNYGHLGDNFVLEGLAHRITPFNTEKTGKKVDSEKMYENLMTRFRFGGLDKPGIYLDETVRRMCITHRRLFSQLANTLWSEGKEDKAAQVVAYAEEAVPASSLPHSYNCGSVDLARIWAQLGKTEEVEKIIMPMAQNVGEYIEWYLSMPDLMLMANDKECLYYYYQLPHMAEVLELAGSQKTDDLNKKIESYAMALQTRLYRASGADRHAVPEHSPTEVDSDMEDLDDVFEEDDEEE